MRKIILKKISIIFLMVIIIMNFIIPNYTYAGVGSDIVNGVFSLLAFLGDTVMSVLQEVMMTGGGIEDQIDGGFRIRYSPGMIFADKIPSLKINFITATADDYQGDLYSQDLETNGDVYRLIVDIAETVNKENLSGINVGGFVDDQFLITSKGIELMTKGNEKIEQSDIRWDKDDIRDAEKYTSFMGIDFYYAYGDIIQQEKKRHDSSIVPPDYFWVHLDENEGHYLTLKLVDGNDWANYKGNQKDAFKDADMDPVIPDNGPSGLGNYEIIWVRNGYLWVMTAGMLANNSDGSIMWDYFLMVPEDGYGGSIWNTSIMAFPLDWASGSVGEQETIAFKLQDEIAKWYVGLRKVAIVGLLSVLLYIGIQIVLKSTSAQDKAKYKNMLKDWLVALCLIFVLHYIMAFLTEFTQSVNGIIQNSAIAEDKNGNKFDELLTTIRVNLEEGLKGDLTSNYTTGGNVVIYLALVILTVVFTLQYLKRVVFLAFLTMIAPMIALTYPLDKIRDGKAQAYSYWLKEYILNCLIQPVHLILYTVFVSSAMEFVKDNLIYAIAALAFMVPAEKFIKEMFGLNSKSPSNELGAAAGGAMVMNMINKMRGHEAKNDTSKSDSSSSGKQSGVRTATRSSNPTVNLNTSNSHSDIDNSNNTSSSATSNSLNTSNNSEGSNNSLSTDLVNNLNNMKAQKNINNSENINNIQNKKSIRKPSIIGGVGSMARRYAPSIAGKSVGILGGIAGATIGLAAGVAGGDLGKAATYVAGGASVGYAGGRNLTHNTLNGIKNIPNSMSGIRNTWNEGYLGTEAYNNKLFDDKFYKSNEYKIIEQDSELIKIYGGANGIKAATQGFLDNGITDATSIRKALQSGIDGDSYKKYTKGGISDPKDMAKLTKAGVDAESYKIFVDMGIKDANKIINAQKALGKGRDVSTVAALAKLAQIAPKDKDKFMEFAQSMKISGKMIEEDEAKEIYKNLVNLL